MSSHRFKKLAIWTLLYPLLGILFLTFAILAILYARGYQYNFETHRLEKTGMILVNSVPEGAKIWQDGRELRKKTPARLTGLLPGQYELVVRRDGYRDWTKELPVFGERVTFARYIILIPHRLDPTLPLQDQSITSTLPSPDQDRLIYTANEGTELWLADWDGSGRERLFGAGVRSDLATPGEAVRLAPVAWSRDSGRTLVRKDSGTPTFWVVAGQSISSLADVLPPGISSIQFDPSDSRLLYFLRDGALFRINLSDLTISSPLQQDVSAYHVSGGDIYSIRAPAGEQGLWRSNVDGTRLALLEALPLGSYTVARSPSEDAIAVLGSARGFLLVNSGGRLTNTSLGAGFSSAEWSRDGKRIVFWQEGRAESYDLERQRRATVASKSGITEVRWTADSHHLVIDYRDGETTFTEFDGGNPFLISGVTAGSFAHLPDRRSFVYLTRSGEYTVASLRATSQ